MSDSERSKVDITVEPRSEPGAAGVQGAGPGRGRIERTLAWGCAGGVILATPLWMTQLSPLWLMLSLLCAVGWSWGALRLRGSWALLSLVAVWALVGISAGVQLRLGEIARAWPALEHRIQEQAGGALNEALDDLVERGEGAVQSIEQALESSAGRPVALFSRLAEIRERTGMAGVAVFDARGGLVAWAGEHRGVVPLAVRRGVRDYVYEEGPLFGHLYFTRPLGGGRTAVATVLLESDVALDAAMVPFAERFQAEHGLTPRFSLPSRVSCEAVWDWSTDRPILSVCFGALTQQNWWERVVRRGRLAAGAGWLAAYLLLCIAWYRRRAGNAGLPVAVGTAALLLAPLGEMARGSDLFSPLLFVLPLPADITLGLLLVLLAGAALWLLTLSWRRGSEPGGAGWWVPPALASLSVPLVLLLVERSAAGGLLASRSAGGLPLQLATTLMMAVPLYLGLRFSRPPRTGTRPRSTLIAMGGLLSVLLAVGLVVVWRPGGPVTAWWTLAWAAPATLLAAGQIRGPEWKTRGWTWILAGWLAGSAALPYLWLLHTGAELDNAERELARIGTEADPFLDFLLRQFGERARQFDREGEEGVNLLYHSWVASGLASEGYDARLSIWRAGQPEAELRLSDMDSIPAVVPKLIAGLTPGEAEVVRVFDDIESLHYLLLLPLDDQRVISVAVPPRRQLGRPTTLARFLQPESKAEAAAYNETLYLVPLDAQPRTAADSAALRDAPVRWARYPQGWRSEARAHFPAGWMHAHLFIRTPTPAMVAVRGLLAQAALLGSLALLWAVARLLCGEPATHPAWRRWVRSFRGRLTLTLFLFFLLPTAMFGVVAYGAVTREVVRSAASIARRALDQALPLTQRDRLAADRSDPDTDLLLYRDGMLVAAAAPEVLHLGLFHSWLPPEVYLRFASGADAEAVEERQLAANEYLVAYQRTDPRAVLAAAIPLASEEITRRQQEFRDVALAATLLGACLSVILSLLAGRALSRPLDQLSRAAAMVGAGNLRVRLPEERPDEFGGMYRSFNRMVRRLMRARAALVRETRRTETIVTEAATGVLALDAAGRVELVNPRAITILGAELERGAPLPPSNPLLESLLDALAEFRRSGGDEAGSDVEVDGRIVRLRLRPLTGAAGLRGTVVALEDVTAEVRTARVLAWGEMARQVAHEIKNPLTPIKLSVQHLRRAYADGRADFEQILERNVEAVLQEIDRLGEIARAFARFGTPQPPDAQLEQVDVARAVEDTLALYRSAGEGIRFHADVSALNGARAVARTGELKEVIVNLLENARDALNGAGEVGVTAAPTPDGGAVEIVVWDTGEGIPAELLPHIFEPHFSTRTSGTGLGLAIVRRLVDSWGGEVEAESEPGAGTRVRIRLRAA